MTPPPHRLAYLGRILPSASETFVVREMAMLRRLGLEVLAFSLYPPDPAVSHPEAPALAQEVEVLVQPANPLFWLVHLYFALFRPRRYCHCLYRYVLRGAASWRDRRRCLAFFAVAPFAAWRLGRARVEHLHAHFANASASVALMAAALAGIRFSFTVHAYDLFIDNLLLPAKLAAAAFVACISQFNIDYIRSRYPEAARANLVVVRNGVDPDRFTPRPPPQESPPVILAVGRLVQTKGFHTLIEACARLRDEHIALRCLIIGEGPEGPRLGRMIRDLKLTDQVFMLGQVPPGNMQSYYQSARMLVMPACVRNNDRDGIPTVLMEALAQEVPVVATRVSGIPEIVRDGETGRLVEPDDPVALAAAMAALLQDEAQAQTLARTGRDLVVREFNSYHTAQQLLGLFQGAIAGPHPSF